MACKKRTPSRICVKTMAKNCWILGYEIHFAYRDEVGKVWPIFINGIKFASKDAAWVYLKSEMKKKDCAQ